MTLPSEGEVVAALTALIEEERDALLASLRRQTRDVARAEDALQEAWAAALERWPLDGLPETPRAWVLTVARRRLVDGLRRERRWESGSPAEATAHAAAPLGAPASAAPAAEDPRLRLLLAVCHPALAPVDRVALALQTTCGLSVAAVARAFVMRPSRMRARLRAARTTLRAQRLGDGSPEARSAAVLSAVYLTFNEGYVPSGARRVREHLCGEALRLARVVAEAMEDAESLGLQALLTLQHARRDARVGADGESLVPLDAQDRSRWHRAEIAAGQAVLARALAKRAPGPYQVQAAIAALHASAATPAETDWAQIAGLYGVLLQQAPTPFVELNAAIALGMSAGPESGLEWLDDLADRSPRMRAHHLLQAARADFLVRLGRSRDAKLAFEKALATVTLPAERRFLETRRQALGGRQRRRRRPLRRGVPPAKLSDAAWLRVAGCFPEPPRRGRPPRADREVLDAVLWALVTGKPWRELPADFPPWRTVYHRFRRWELDGTLARVLPRLAHVSAAGRDATRAWAVAGADGPAPH